MILNFLDLSQHIEQTGNTTRKTLQKFRSRSSVNFASQRYCKTAHVPSQYFSEARGKIATGGLFKGTKAPKHPFRGPRL